MDYRPFYKAVSAWNREKSLKNLKHIYVEGFSYEKPSQRPVYRLFKIFKNTISGKYKESEEDLKLRWEVIKDDLTTEDKIKLASDPNTFGNILSCLADEESPFIHIRAIINPNIPLYKLWDLSFSEDWAKRHAILLNPKVSDELLEKLSKDKNGTVFISANRKLQERKYTTLDNKIIVSEETSFRRSTPDISKTIKQQYVK